MAWFGSSETVYAAPTESAGDSPFVVGGVTASEAAVALLFGLME